jgi:hypothetical protein
MEQLDVQGKAEEAFRRTLAPFMGAELSALQLIWRGFTGKPKEKRLSISVPRCDRSLADEDGAPLSWACPVVLKLTTNTKDDGPVHDELVAKVASATYGGSAFCTELTVAMEKEGFRALIWESDVSREYSKDGTAAETVINGMLELQVW